MIRLAAVDMDGTLLNPEGRISERTARTIRDFQNMGRELLICTGRSYADAMEPLKEWGLSAAVACMNGAALYDRQGNLLMSRHMEYEQVGWILRCCQGLPLLFDFMTDQGSVTINTEEDLHRVFATGFQFPIAAYSLENIKRRFRIVPLEELFDQGLTFYKISLIQADTRVLEEAERRIKADAGLSVAASDPYNRELTHKKAQKGWALTLYAAMKGIDLREAMAIGDSENDRSMLSLDLRYTVAMGNAMESIRKLARCCTRTNGEDGAAYALENLAMYRLAAAV